MARRICVVTGSRAEYGLLRWVLQALVESPGIELQLAVTGMHLAPEFGLTVREIEADGLDISARIEMLVSSDTPVGIAKSVSLGVAGFADAFDRLRPDVLVVLGDRFEILAAAQAALFSNIPIAHIAGGDITEGAFDDAVRHCLTKMSHIHFVTNEHSARRVRQMGENPSNVHVVGSTGIDSIRRLPLLDRASLECDIGVRFRQRNLLITFHPETIGDGRSHAQLAELLAAVSTLNDEHGLFFTMPNADTGGRELRRNIEEFVAERTNAAAFVSLGQLRYLSLMRVADVVVGNSSSALYEAPALFKPAVNIGNRQKGRLRAASVIDVVAERGAIRAAVVAAMALDCSKVTNPFGDGRASERIVTILRSLENPRALLVKRFMELEST